MSRARQTSLRFGRPLAVPHYCEALRFPGESSSWLARENERSSSTNSPPLAATAGPPLRIRRRRRAITAPLSRKTDLSLGLIITRRRRVIRRNYRRFITSPRLLHLRQAARIYATVVRNSRINKGRARAYVFSAVRVYPEVISLSFSFLFVFLPFTDVCLFIQRRRPLTSTSTF